MLIIMLMESAGLKPILRNNKSFNYVQGFKCTLHKDSLFLLPCLNSAIPTKEKWLAEGKIREQFMIEIQ